VDKTETSPLSETAFLANIKSEAYIVKHFKVVINSVLLKARGFVTVSHLFTRLTFAGKARSSPKGLTFV
jgi:hypothetical protein